MRWRRAVWVGLLGVAALCGCSDLVRADLVALPEGICVHEEISRNTIGATSLEIRDALLVWCEQAGPELLEQVMLDELERQFDEIGQVPEWAGGGTAFRGRSGDVVLTETDAYRRTTEGHFHVDDIHEAIAALSDDIDSVVLTVSAERVWSDGRVPLE